ncbi:MAG: hypothetical protein RH859_00730 [Longimicrobiales bacterium]
MTEQQKESKGARERVTDGIKDGIGVLSAFKDALEETIHEARERGDLSSERAKEVMKSALGRAQDAAEGARERLDLVTQKEFDGLKDAVDRIRERVDALEVGLRTKNASADDEPEAGDPAP